MRISTKGRYSIEALLYMALLPDGEACSTRQISGETGISDGYLEQLFIPLRRSGLIQGTRGPQGGYRPGRSPEKIRVGDILRSVEGPMEPVPCINPGGCSRTGSCQSRPAWLELYREIGDCIDSISLQDLVDAYRNMDMAEYMI